MVHSWGAAGTDGAKRLPHLRYTVLRWSQTLVLMGMPIHEQMRCVAPQAGGGESRRPSCGRAVAMQRGRPGCCLTHWAFFP